MQRPTKPPAAAAEARNSAESTAAEPSSAEASSAEDRPNPARGHGPGEAEAPLEPAMVDRSMQAQLGQQLRAMFDHVANEPVPERLLKLLEQLESKENDL